MTVILADSACDDRAAVDKTWNVRHGMVERHGTGCRLGERLHHLGQAVYGPQAERAMDQPLRRFTDRTITDPDELDRLRPTGVAFDDEEHQPGLVCVATPVLDRGGRSRRRRWPAGTAVSKTRRPSGPARLAALLASAAA